MPPSFPDPRSATAEGIVAIGGDLRPERLMEGYRNGIFPWPTQGLPMLWFSPPERGILEIGEVHVSRSLERARRKSTLRYSFDEDFAQVLATCASVPRPAQDGTWITASIVRGYLELHVAGFAHSVEAWDGEELVGGLYGVDVDGAFAAESMFYRQPNASKLVLLYLLDHFAQRGLDWIDIQVLTPHLEQLGGKEIGRETFLRRLAATRERGLRLFGEPESNT